VCAGILGCVLLPTIAHAQAVDDATRRAARNLGTAGVAAFEAKDYATASDKLDRAYRALKVPSLGLWSARAFVKENHLIEAAERYQEVARLEIAGGERAVQVQAKADAASELALLEPQIPNLVAKVEGAATEGDALQVTIDGVPIASALVGENRPVNPGTHHVQATSGGKSVEVDAEVALGETKTVELRFPESATAAAVASTAPTGAVPATKRGSTQRTFAIVALGVGAGGLVIGGVAGAMALSKKSTINGDMECQGNRCLKSQADTVNSYSTWRTVSSIGLIGGAVVAATGAVLLITAPKQAEQTAIWLGPGSIQLSRTF
jgi:hypothetical protein